jgi:hypothetical protein
MKNINHARCAGALVGGVTGIIGCDLMFSAAFLGSGYAVALVVVLSIVAALVAGRVHRCSREVQFLAGAVIFGSLALALCGTTLYVSMQLVKGWSFLAQGLSTSWMVGLATVPVLGWVLTAYLLRECRSYVARMRNEKSTRTS